MVVKLNQNNKLTLTSLSWTRKKYATLAINQFVDFCLQNLFMHVNQHFSKLGVLSINSKTQN